MRFIVEVNSDWRVTVKTEGGDLIGAPRDLRRIAVPELGDFPAPPTQELPPPPPAGAPDADKTLYALLKGDEPDIYADAYDDLARRPVPRGAGDTFGQYLFATLLGTATWSEILKAAAAAGTTTIELALLWDSGDNALHRLYWELMKNGARFLAAGVRLPPDDTKGCAVAITRLVRAEQEAVQLEHPPRVLFVVGASPNDERIRPATEIVGLLRQIREDGRTIRWRAVANATPTDVRDAMTNFSPQVVHFICHGGINGKGQGYLELPYEKDNPDKNVNRIASDLKNYLAVNYPRLPNVTLPPIVVLSACYSSTAGPARMGGADMTGPLAAELVKEGIPIVIGMGGSVTDVACRLFTTSLADALVRGETLIEATEKARRATFFKGANPNESIDWAFPAVFMASAVNEDYAPVNKDMQDATQQIASWIHDFGLKDEPIFCGRDEFFEEFNKLLFTPGPQDKKERERNLAVRVKNQNEGVGRTRLLKELAIQALLAGHIPVLIQDTYPTSLEEFVRVVHEKLKTIRTILEIPLTSQLGMLRQLPDVDELLDKDIRQELKENKSVGLPPRAVRRALELDFKQLAAEAQRQYPFLKEAGGRAVVLLDDVHKYGAFASVLLNRDQLMSANGFGTRLEPVPVVMTVSISTDSEGKIPVPSDSALSQLLDEAAGRKWLIDRELAVFRENDEEMLAYEWVLLNPLEKKIYPDVSDRAWARNDTATDEDRKYWAGVFRQVTAGMPGKIKDKGFYLMAGVAAHTKFLSPAKDKEYLELLKKEQWPS